VQCHGGGGLHRTLPGLFLSCFKPMHRTCRAV